MLPNTHHRQQRPIAWIAALCAMLVALVYSSQIAYASESEWTGKIESMPSNEIGTWVVKGRSFVSDSSTELDKDKGDFAVGVCVEVEYVGSAEPFQRLVCDNGRDTT